MELFSADINHIKSLVEDWKRSPEVELEACFGMKGTVNMETFLRVIRRLKSKGFHEISQEDRLTVSLPDSTRFTLMGDGQVKKYCNDNTMAGKPYIAITKDRNISKENEAKANIDLKDYDVRIKARREMPFAKDDKRVQDLLATWPKHSKFFRLIRRWTFHGNGVKFDLSMVRSNFQGKTTNFFENAKILQETPVYEIEVELDRSSFKEDSTIDAIYGKFIQGVGEILRGIQGNSMLLRNSVKQRVLNEYKELTGIEGFRGVAPVTLGVRHMTADMSSGDPNIRTGYNVTDKADGLRVHGFTDKKGELFMIDMSMNVYKTGLLKESCKNVLMDGEYVTQDKHGKAIQDLLFFDIYYFEGKDVSQKPFQGDTGRYVDMRVWMTNWTNDGGPIKQMKSSELDVSLKTFRFAKGNDIFKLNLETLNNDSLRIYHTDGLILTPNTLPLPARPEGFLEQFKWKPADENSVDFLVKLEKDVESKKEDKITSGLHPDTQEVVRYKTVRLLVSSREQQNPRTIILNKLPLGEARGGKPRPVLFTPNDYPDLMANVCYLVTETDPQTGEEYIKTEINEPIRDKSIVEMRYDGTRSPGWRWIPMRNRMEKTERYARGIIPKTMNSSLTANDIWLSIHNPVTKHMITTGSEVPTDEERAQMAVVPSGIQTKYREKQVDKKDKSRVQTMLDFHNKYIKWDLLYGAIFAGEKTKTLLDMTVGEASDLNKWINGKATFVLGVDLAGESITNPEKGAYSRLLSRFLQQSRYRRSETLPSMFFVIGDSSKRLKDGSAGVDEENMNMLRSILGYPIQGPVPALVEEKGAGELKNGVDTIVCMYALHYFFESEEKFNGYLQNIADNLKVGGYFVGTNFDGETVFDFLRSTAKGNTKSGIEDGSVLWELTKEYDQDNLPNDSSGFGMAVDVKFITIGMKQREYLVPWQLLVNKLKTIGCELVSGDELKTLGLAKSTNLYKDSYEMVKDKFKITSEVAKQFSFLNRWYIFKRMGNSETVQMQQVSDEPKEKFAELASQFEHPATVTNLVKSVVAPVAPVEGGPVIMLKDKYSVNEVYQFKENSPEFDKKLDLPEKYKSYSARWLAPNAPFPIKDTTDHADTTMYPSITHFLSGMKCKYATNNPLLAKNIFGTDGSIHQKYLGQRVAIKKITKDKHYELLANETKEVENESNKQMKTKNLGYDSMKWQIKFDELLRVALQQRLEKDKWFCVIINALVQSGKYLLYQDSETSTLGGVRKVDGSIKGENKYGKTILQLATSSPDTLKSCINSGNEPPM